MGVGVRQEKGQAEKQKVCTVHCCTESPSPRDSTDMRPGNYLNKGSSQSALQRD